VSAGNQTQGVNAVAVGSSAGQIAQGTNTIAIGTLAGNDNQGGTSIAIGASAGQINQHQNTIILNATGSALNSDGTSRFFVKPIRNASTSDILFYNSSSSEVTSSSLSAVLSYRSMISGVINAFGGGTRFVGLDTQNTDSTEIFVQIEIPFACTLSNFYVRYNAGQSPGNGFSYVIRRNGVDTTVAVSLTGATVNGSNIVNTASFSLGDLFSISVNAIGSPSIGAGTSAKWSARLTAV